MERRKEQYIWYHSYPIPKIHDLPDAVAYAYRDGICLGSNTVAIALEGSLGQQESEFGGNVVIEARSEKRTDREYSRLKLVAFMLWTENAPEDS